MLLWPKASGCCCGSDPGPSIGNVSFHVAGACHRGRAHPHLSVWTVQEGSPDPVNAIQTITFGGSPSGGTFRLNGALFQETANIAWNADPATLAASIQAALIALAAYGPADVVVSPLPGSYKVEFTGAKAGLNIAPMTVTNNSLTGTSPTITIQNAQVGSANLNEFQQLILGLEANGGTFKLEFDGQTTASITWAMSGGAPNYTTIAANIDAALEALSNIPAGGISVGIDLLVEFTGGLAGTDVVPMTIAENLLTTPTTATRVPLDGAAIVLYKGGVEHSAGTTNADGNVILPIYEPGTDFTVGVDHPDYWPGANTVGAYSPIAAGRLGWGRNGGTRTELERPLLVPFIIEADWGPFVPGHDPGDPVVGAAVSVVGVAGTRSEGFSEAGVTDADGMWWTMVPSTSPYDAIDSIFDYLIDPPGDASPFGDTLSIDIDGECGFRIFGPTDVAEWPADGDLAPFPHTT